MKKNIIAISSKGFFTSSSLNHSVHSVRYLEQFFGLFNKTVTNMK